MFYCSTTKCSTVPPPIFHCLPWDVLLFQHLCSTVPPSLTRCSTFPSLDVRLFHRWYSTVLPSDVLVFHLQILQCFKTSVPLFSCSTIRCSTLPPHLFHRPIIRYCTFNHQMLYCSTIRCLTVAPSLFYFSIMIVSLFHLQMFHCSIMRCSTVAPSDVPLFHHQIFFCGTISVVRFHNLCPTVALSDVLLFHLLLSIVLPSVGPLFHHFFPLVHHDCFTVPQPDVPLFLRYSGYFFGKQPRVLFDENLFFC